MEDQEKQIIGHVKSYVNGFLNLFSYCNLYQGRESLGDKIIDSTNDSKIKNKSPAFALGYFTELALELAVPIYMASSSDSIKWYHVLIVDLAIKTIPRGLERILNRGKSKADE